MRLLAIMSIRAPRANHRHKASHSQRFASACVGAGPTGQFMKSSSHCAFRGRVSTALGERQKLDLHRPRILCELIGHADDGAILATSIAQP